MIDRKNEKPVGKVGFTLIELLVVIAIISLLVSILLPSLTKAKLLAQATVCGSQLKQWNYVHLLYADDNDGAYVYTPRGDVKSPEYVHTGYLTYMVDQYDVPEKMFFCPAVGGSVEENVAWTWYTGTGYTYLGQYPESCSSFFNNNYESPMNVQTAQVWWVLMTDLCRGDYAADSKYTNHWMGQDTAGTNVLFVDGHVEFQTSGLEPYFSAEPWGYYGFVVLWRAM